MTANFDNFKSELDYLMKNQPMAISLEGFALYPYKYCLLMMKVALGSFQGERLCKNILSKLTNHRYFVSIYCC